ncbi:MAG: hypothetical protein LBC90_04270, partial [Candidatus Adiutrix sp.]|nr:hypothetical protein [Candidatus Adiutrix sp.]
MNLSLNTIVNQTGNMKPDQTLYLRQDDTLGKASGLGRLARLFSGPRQAENRASVERLKQAVASHPEFKNLLSDSAIKHFFTQKLASGTALTVGEVEALKADLDTLNTLQVGRALVRSGVLPEGFAKDFAIFTASHQLPLKTETEQAKALRDYYKENLLPGLLRGACRKAGVSQGYLDKAVDMIRATDEFREYSEKLFSGETKNLNFTLAPKALALMPALAGNPNTLGTLPQDKVPAIFNSLVEMARAGEITPDRAKAFLDFCTERGLSLSQPLERHRALGVWLLEPRAEKENWGADLAEKMKLPTDVGRTVANMPEVNGQILAKLLAPPSAPPTRELVEQAAKEVMTGFLTEKGEIINKFLKINQSVPKDLQEMLYFPPGS